MPATDELCSLQSALVQGWARAGVITPRNSDTAGGATKRLASGRAECIQRPVVGSMESIVGNKEFARSTPTKVTNPTTWATPPLRAPWAQKEECQLDMDGKMWKKNVFGNINLFHLPPARDSLARAGRNVVAGF